MLNITKHRPARTSSLSTAGVALIAALTFGSAPVRGAEVNPRDFQAFGYDIQLQGQFPGEVAGEWRKPNGAEILGGFYGADDRIDTHTGEVRHR
jgi:hypothetical protein